MSQTQSNQPSELLAREFINPLGLGDKELLEKVISNNHLIHDLLNRAEQAGIDIGPRRDMHASHQAVAQRMHALFFPPELPHMQE